MPTRKQRRRALKERRHEYETVWVDDEGNELEEPPEELAPTPEKRYRADGKPKPKAVQQRGRKPGRVPPQPSWQRATKRALIIGAVIFVFFYLSGSRNGGNRLGFAVEITLLYTVLFIPFTFMIDRFSYNRWQRRADEQPAKRPAKKR
jgi:hypothetical protein